MSIAAVGSEGEHAGVEKVVQGCQVCMKGPRVKENSLKWGLGTSAVGMAGGAGVDSIRQHQKRSQFRSNSKQSLICGAVGL